MLGIRLIDLREIAGGVYPVRVLIPISGRVVVQNILVRTLHRKVKVFAFGIARLAHIANQLTRTHMNFLRNARFKRL